MCYIQQINGGLYSGGNILRYCQECRSLEEFESDSMRVEATVFNLMQIGELSKTSLSDAAKDSIPSIPWKQIYGLLNRIVHGYDGVDMRIVWDTVSEDIPRLQAGLADINCEDEKSNSSCRPTT